ncbi:helix-turn-helix transcriptional regulator [Tyzzerella sp. OttesenSCG-928-J15]|nr:helix-turn-helix transcriptional regulator [Tyzzerella sp. OttesenSCG-928-J15]
MMSYVPFWNTLKSKKISQYALINKHGISRGTIANIKNNKPMETTTIEKFCKILNCNVQDIVIYIPDEEPGQL